MTFVTPQTLHAIREVVDHALDAAAEVTLPKFRSPVEIDNKDAFGFDPVTVADREAEQVIRNVLAAALPHAGFLGEENSVPPTALSADKTVSMAIDLIESAQAELTWVVDPIDGTRAFITGLPLWGTLIALNNGAEVLYGALDQPWMGERFIGYGDHAERIFKGVAHPLRTRGERALGDCIVQTTTPDMFKDDHSRKSFESVRQRVSMIRYGGDCYAYALLVMGGVDAVIESSLQPYDIQALIPIVQGAGGVITNWEGAPCLSGGQVVAAANASVHQQLLDALNG